jgi:hypothetical protein
MAQLYFYYSAMNAGKSTALLQSINFLPHIYGNHCVRIGDAVVLTFWATQLRGELVKLLLLRLIPEGHHLGGGQR